MTGAVSAIDCPNCGVGLSVLGGGRVTTQVCTYCGASLDASDAFRVLKINAERPRPASPFRLGMTGLVDGVEHTIIGTIGYVEKWKGDVWRWADHMLYSPTHGYSWLTVEDGHTLLTRKVRDWPDGPFLTSAAVELAESRPSRRWHGFDYLYYATSNWEIEFVEGGFTWRPEVGQRGSTVSLMRMGAAHDMLAYNDTGEREVERTRWFPEAAAAFGVEPLAAEGVHPLQPYIPASGKSFYKRWFFAMTAAAASICVAVIVASGPRVPLYSGPPNAIPDTLTYEVSRTSRPVRLQLYQDLAQSWAEYEVAVTDPSGTPIAATERGISYYFGGSGEDSWTEGSRFSSLDFKPTEAGPYTIEIAMISTDGGKQVPLAISVQEGKGHLLWAILAAIGFLVAFLWTASSKLRHRGRRWSGGDWTEEEDD